MYDSFLVSMTVREIGKRRGGNVVIVRSGLLSFFVDFFVVIIFAVVFTSMLCRCKDSRSMCRCLVYVPVLWSRLDLGCGGVESELVKVVVFNGTGDDRLCCLLLQPSN